MELLYGVRILVVDYFVLSQSTRLKDRQTDRQNCHSNTVRCITCSRTVKTILEVYSLYAPSFSVDL